jgi:hypothetical protein
MKSKSMFAGHEGMTSRKTARIRRFTRFRLFARLNSLFEATNPTFVAS